MEMVVIAQDMDLSQQGTEKHVPQYGTTPVVETAGKSGGTAVELGLSVLIRGKPISDPILCSMQGKGSF